VSVEGRPLEEVALVERARLGDLAAYEELVRRYQQLAFRTAYLVTGGEEEAEDAVQEAFVKAFRALPRFRAGSPLRPWLLRIVANEARNRRRAAARRAALVSRMTQDRPSAGAASSAEEAVLAAERRAALVAAFDRLGPDDRLVIACRYFLELTEAETASAIGRPRGTVKSRLSRALGRLRGELDRVAEAADG
jgi:RNA polymerase sigma factor (sigma-70 family)